MVETDRTRRVSELIKREVSHLIARELHDGRINTVTVTAVTVSRDLKHSTVYFSSMEDTADHGQLEKLLNNSAGFLRRSLGKSLSMKTTPSLSFRYDDSIQRGVDMSQLIDRLNRGKPPGND